MLGCKKCFPRSWPHFPCHRVASCRPNAGLLDGSQPLLGNYLHRSAASIRTRGMAFNRRDHTPSIVRVRRRLVSPPAFRTSLPERILGEFIPCFVDGGRNCSPLHRSQTGPRAKSSAEAGATTERERVNKISSDADSETRCTVLSPRRGQSRLGCTTPGCTGALWRFEMDVRRFERSQNLRAMFGYGERGAAT